MNRLWERFLAFVCFGPDCWRDQDYDDPNDEYRRAARGDEGEAPGRYQP